MIRLAPPQTEPDREQKRFELFLGEFRERPADQLRRFDPGPVKLRGYARFKLDSVKGERSQNPGQMAQDLALAKQAPGLAQHAIDRNTSLSPHQGVRPGARQGPALPRSHLIGGNFREGDRLDFGDYFRAGLATGPVTFAVAVNTLNLGDDSPKPLQITIERLFGNQVLGPDKLNITANR